MRKLFTFNFFSHLSHSSFASGFLFCANDRTRGPATQEIIKGYPALVTYAKRIHDKYFPDYELWE